MVVEQWNDYLDMSKDDTGVQSGPIPVDKGMNEGVKGKKYIDCRIIEWLSSTISSSSLHEH